MELSNESRSSIYNYFTDNNDKRLLLFSSSFFVFACLFLCWLLLLLFLFLLCFCFVSVFCFVFCFVFDVVVVVCLFVCLFYVFYIDELLPLPTVIQSPDFTNAIPYTYPINFRLTYQVQLTSLKWALNGKLTNLSIENER